MNSKKNFVSRTTLSLILFFVISSFAIFSQLLPLSNFSINFETKTNKQSLINEDDINFTIVDDSITDNSFRFNLMINPNGNNFNLDPNLVYLTSNNYALNTICLGGQTDNFYDLFYEVNNLKSNQVYSNFELFSSQSTFSDLSFMVPSSIFIKTNHSGFAEIIFLIVLIIFIILVIFAISLSIIFYWFKTKRKNKIFYEKNTYYWHFKKQEPIELNQEEMIEENYAQTLPIEQNEQFLENLPIVEPEEISNEAKTSKNTFKNKKKRRKKFKADREFIEDENSENFSLSVLPFDKISNNKKVRKRRRDFNNLVKENEFFKVKTNEEKDLSLIDDYEF